MFLPCIYRYPNGDTQIFLFVQIYFLADFSKNTSRFK